MTTMIPPPNREAKTDPPERARESSLPPVDPLAADTQWVRMMSIEAKVNDIRNSMAAIAEAVEKIAADVGLLVADARGQRLDKMRMRRDLDELESRVDRMVKDGA